MPKRLPHPWRLLLLSLPLAAALVMWVRSHRGEDYPQAHFGYWGVAGYSTAGGVRFSVAHYAERHNGVHWEVADHVGSYAGGNGPGWLGFCVDAERSGHWYGLTLPYYFIAAACAAAPVLSVARQLRKRRPGLCPRCGYDLRATPDRCPECGAAPLGTDEYVTPGATRG